MARVPAASRAHSLAVVIPTRNSARFLERSLGSVFSQAELPDEVVVVDDGSTDDTTNVLARYSSRVRALRRAPGGVASARNAGVEACTAEFVAFLDADDFWYPDHLSRMRSAIDETEGRGALYFSDMDIATEHGGGTLWTQAGITVGGDYEYHDSDKSLLFLRRQPVLIQASVVQRTAYHAVGGCDTGLTRASDTHLIFKLGLYGPLCAVAGSAGLRTADDEHSLTHRFGPKHRVAAECNATLYADLLSRFPGLPDEQRKVLRSRAASAYMSLARHDRPTQFARHFVRACIFDPGIVQQRLVGRVTRRGKPHPDGVSRFASPSQPVAGGAATATSADSAGSAEPVGRR